MQTDMDIADRNFIILLQEKIELLVVSPTVNIEIRNALNDLNFLKKVIEIIMKEFAKTHNKENSLELLLPKHHQTEMEKWFIEKFREKMAGILVVHFTDKITFGFHLGSDGGNARFNFETGLVEAFSNFCSPRFRKHFFPSHE